MKIIAIAVALFGASALHVSSASADISNIQCDDNITSQTFHDPPQSCPAGSIYDAGDVGIFRTCSYFDGTATQFCQASFVESFFHNCSDGSFNQQVNTIAFNNCPF
jgi:hypothetical protein